MLTATGRARNRGDGGISQSYGRNGRNDGLLVGGAEPRQSRAAGAGPASATNESNNIAVGCRDARRRSRVRPKLVLQPYATRCRGPAGAKDGPLRRKPAGFHPLGWALGPLTARLRSRLCLVAKAVRRQETEPGTLVTGPNPRNDRGAMTVVESLPGFHPFGWGTGSRPRPQAKNQANSGFCPFAAHRCHSYTRDIGHGRGLRGVRALSGGNTRALRALGNCCAAGRSGRPGSISPSLTPSDGDH